LAERGVVPRTVIDVGVAEGTPELYAGVPEAHFLLVEPVAEYEPDLRAICADYDAEYAICVASDAPGEVELAIPADSRKASLLGRARASTRTVAAARVDDLIEERGLDGPYALKVDVEGAELQVLRGAPRVLRNAALVILEVYLWDERPAVPELAEVLEHMARAGFAAYDLVAAGPAPNGGLRHVDIAFVPRDSVVRRID
jgi:FkbM family methyltransferase